MKKNLLAAVLVFGFGSSALAADTGEVKVHGKINSMFSIEFDSTTSTIGSNATPSGALDYTIDFSTLLNDTSLTGIQREKVKFKLRSNAAYGLYAVRQDGTPTTASDVAPSDIGFAITSVDETGSLVAAGAVTDNPFDKANDAVTVTDGAVTFVKTLADLDAGSTATNGNTMVLEGGRISNKGGFNNPNNAIIVESEFAMLPQFFQGGDFEYTVHFTVAAP